MAETIEDVVERVKLLAAEAKRGVPKISASHAPQLARDIDALLAVLDSTVPAEEFIDQDAADTRSMSPEALEEAIADARPNAVEFINRLLDAARSEGHQPPAVKVEEGDIEWLRKQRVADGKRHWSSWVRDAHNARIDRLLSVLGSRHEAKTSSGSGAEERPSRGSPTDSQTSGGEA